MHTRTRRRRSHKSDEDEKALSELSMFDRAAKSIYSVLDNSYNDRMILDAKNQRFRNILNRELEISKGYSNGSIVDFVSSLNLNKDKKLKDEQMTGGLSPNTNDLFTKNINDIFGYFQEMHRNKFIEMTDLKFISKFIPALGEAVKTVLDEIVASDNISENINRKISLSSGVSKEDETAITNEIKRMEKELKLLQKLKNIVFKKTLITGTHYVYAVSYNRIFEEYDAIKKKNKVQVNNLQKNQFGNYVDKDKLKGANESLYQLGDVDISIAMESVKDLLSSSELETGTKKRLTKKEIETRLGEACDLLPQITCESSIIYTEALDDMDTLMESDGAMEAYFAALEKENAAASDKKLSVFNPLELKVPDGTFTGDSKRFAKPSKFNIPGTYIKYIEPKNLIPVKVFDKVIGYYLIHAKDKKGLRTSSEVQGITSIGNTLFSAVNIGETKKHDAVQRIVDTISDGILKNFDKKFATKNAHYKKLIADVIVANGLTDKDYNIQFIPESDIIPFTIQENEEGYGESILSDSLFPAKLLLSMIVTRMLNYINKTGNKTIAHIHRGPVNAHDNNQIQRIIRDLQDQDVTFNDLLSPNLVFNKFNRDGNMVIPTARNDQRLVEFEMQEGQNIDMTPEYEKQLENMAILGTGVPSVIMEYVQSADFAKQIVSAHIKFAGRVASLQADLEEPTTILYKKLCENSNLTDEQKTICAQSLQISLPRPRVLINSNTNDFISNLQQAAETTADLMLGRDTLTNTDINPDGMRIKELLMLELVKMNSPFLEWEEYEKIMEKVELQVTEENEKRKNNSANNTGMDDSGSGGDTMF